MNINERGIIIPPGYEFDKYRNLSYLGTVHPDTLRKYLLYWDKIDIPTSRKIGYEHNQEIEANEIFLESEGVLEHTFHDNGDIFRPRSDVTSIENALTIRNMNQPGQWSIVNHTSSIPQSELNQNSIIEIKIYDILPIPSRDASFQDILNFKSNRNDELLDLRHHLDELYQQVLSCPDRHRGLNTALTDLNKSINNINKVTDTNLFSRIVSCFSIELNIGGLISLTDSYLNSDFKNILLNSSSFISIDVKEVFHPKIPVELKAFSYLIDAKNI
jgi:hypothetical protein